MPSKDLNVVTKKKDVGKKSEIKEEGYDCLLINIMRLFLLKKFFFWTLLTLDFFSRTFCPETVVELFRLCLLISPLFD